MERDERDENKNKNKNIDKQWIQKQNNVEQKHRTMAVPNLTTRKLHHNPKAHF